MIVNFHNVISGYLDPFDRFAAPRVDLRQFTVTIDWLADRFEFISFATMLSRIKADRPVDTAITLTFDDGYQGVLSNAFPVLKKRGIAASVMIVTQALDSPSKLFHFEELEMALRITKVKTLKLPERAPCVLQTIWDRISCLHSLKRYLKLLPEPRRAAFHCLALERLEVTPRQLEEKSQDLAIFKKLDIDQLRFLAQSGWVIGSHTQTHRTLSCLDNGDALAELTGSYDAIRTRLGFSNIPFAYPYGGPQHIGDHIHPWLSRIGYTCGLTTSLDKIPLGRDRFRLPRINVEDFYRHYPEVLGESWGRA